jgi:hypothetical protein
MKHTTTPASITQDIGLRLNADFGGVASKARLDAVQVIVRNFMNNTRKTERGFQGSMAQIIIEILTESPEIDARDLMDVADLLAAGDARSSAEADADLKARIAARRLQVAA